jgi:gliding motility-associated-like protein
MTYRFYYLRNTVFLVLVLSVLSFRSALSQATFSKARHETLPQTQTLVEFSQAVTLGATPTLGWTVKVAGTPLTPTSVVATAQPTVLLVTFDAHTATGHMPGEVYVKPGDAVLVSYDASVGSLSSAGGVTTFTDQASLNNWVFTCGDVTKRTQGIIPGFTVDQCIPVVMNFWQWQFELSLRYRNSSTFLIGTMFYSIAWGDATTDANVAVQQVDATFNPSTTYIEPAGFSGNPGIIINGTKTHNYPSTTTGAAPNSCDWNAVITPKNTFTGLSCPSVAHATTFANYDTDNANTGTLQLPPLVAGTNNVCLGTNVGMQFNDNTLLNCRLSQEKNVPNQDYRYVRIVYGSQDNGGVGNIPDIFVTLPAALGGATVQITNNNGTGTLIAPGGYYPTAGSADPNGVITIPPSVTAPTGTSYMGTIFTSLFNNQVVNQKLWVRMDYWDVCNPYNSLTPNSPAPVSISVPITIIQNNNAPTVNPLTFCANQGNATYTMTATSGGPAGGGTFKWYSNPGLTTQVQTGATYNPVTTTPFVNKNPAVATTTNFYITETIGTGCVSPAATVPFTVVPAVVAGTISYAGSSPACTGYDPPAITGTAATKGDGVTYAYQWQSSTDGGTTYNNIAGATAQNYDPPALTTTTIFRRVDSSGPCASVNTNSVTIQIDQVVSGGTVGSDQTICTGSIPSTFTVVVAASGGNGTFAYQWQSSTVGSGGPFSNASGTSTNATYTAPAALTQTTYYRRVASSGVCAGPLGSQPSNVITVTVNQTVNGGTVSSSQTICSGQTPIPLTSVLGASGGDGTTYAYLWQQSTTSSTGPWSNASGANTGLTYTPPSLTLTTFYQRLATSGVCSSQPSNAITITVNPLPTADVSGGGSVCSGTPAPDVIFTLTGTGPWNVVYTINGLTQPTLVGITSPYHIVNPGLGTYVITSVTDNNTCNATAPSANITGSATVISTLIPPPTVDSFTASSAVCDNGVGTTPPIAILDLQPNSVQNYDFTYTINGHTHVFTNQPSDAAGVLNLAPPYSDWGSVPGAYPVTITALKNTATGCAAVVPFSSPNLVVNPRPAAPTGGVGATACSSPVGGPGATIKVNAPGGGFTIQWFADVAGTIAATGVTGGAQGEQFTPASNATFTYYAFTFSTTMPTLCQSSTGLAVVHTQDVLPAAANAGPDQPNVCASAANVTLAGNVATSGGTGTWTGPGGVSFVNLHNPTTTASGLSSPVPGGAPIQTTLTWTIASALGVCPNSTDNIIVTINSLPTSVDPAPQLCEDVFGGGSHAGVNLTSYESSVTNTVAAPGTTVSWFNDIGHTSPVGSPTSVTVTNGKKYYFIATSPAPFLCTNTGQITFTVNPLPTAANQNISFCEDLPFPPHSNQHGPIDLTAYNIAIAGGSMANRNVAWFTDAGLTIPVASPATYTLVGSLTLYAQVTNTITSCSNVANVNLTTNPRPTNNPVTGNTSVCTGNNIILYQLDPTLNPGSTYTWSVVGTPAAAVTVFGGGGTNSANFFVLLKFPGATGTVNIDVYETLNGCNGNTQHMTVVVNSAPAPNTITGVTQVCTNQTSVPYSVTTPNGTSTYAWSVTGATPSGSGSLINVDFGTITPVTIQVTETSISGCAGAPASVLVTVNPRPVMTSASVLTICSGDTPPNNFFAASINPSSFAWTVASITGGITGTSVSQSGTGDLAATFTGGSALRNMSGAVGSVTFNVTPTATATGCSGTTQSFVLTVNPEPVLVTPQVKTICSGEQVKYEILTTPANLPANNTFTWAAPAMSDLSTQGTAGNNVPAGAPGTLHINDVLTNTTTLPITATYTIHPMSGAGCAGSPHDVVITVNPQPVMTSTNSNTICSGTPPTLTFTSSVASTYAWIVTNITGTLTGVTNSQTGTGNLSLTFSGPQLIKNTSTSAATVTFNVTPTSSTGSGCVGAPQVVTLTVEPEPLMTSSPTTTICSGDTPTLSFTSSITATYSWVVTSILGTVTGIGNGQMGNGNLSNTFSGAGAIKNVSGAVATITFSVVPVATAGLNCAGAPPQTVTMTVNPAPVMTSSNSTTICSQGTPSLVFSANVASTFGWTVTGITGTPTGVLVNQTGAGDLSSTFTGAQSIVNKSGALATVTFSVVPTASTGTNCVGSPQTVTLTINPEPQMTSSNVDAICSGGTPALIFTSDVASSYTWKVTSILGTLSGVVVSQTGSGDLSATFTGGSAIRNTTVSSGKVTFDVTPTSTTGTGCVGTPQSVTLTVNPEPVMTSPTNPLPYCSGSAPSLTFTSSVPSTYNWIVTAITGTLSNVSISQSGSGNLSLTFTGPAAIKNTSGSLGSVTFSVTPTSTSGLCVGAAQSVTISINPEPVMTSSPTAAICSGQTPTLTFTSSIASTYNWQVSAITGTVTGVSVLQTGSGDLSSTFAGGSAIKNTSTGVATVQFLVTPTSATGSGCVGAAQPVTLTVNPEPVMTSSTAPSVCSGDSPSSFTFTSSIAATYNWSVTNITGTLSGVSLLQSGTGDLSATFVGANAIRNISTTFGIVTFNVVPTAGGCTGAPQVVSLTVNPEPTGSDFTQPGCVNATPLNHNIQTQVSNVAGVFTYTVSSDNAGVPAGPNRLIASSALIADSYNNTTGTAATITYLITPYSSSNNCVGAPFKYIVTVSPVPVGSGTPGPADLCSRSTISLNPQSFITNGVISTFTWTATYDPGLTGGVGSGTGNISDVLTNTTGGVLQAKYQVQASASGCLGTPFTIIQKVNPEPVMTAALATPVPICSTNSVSSNPTAITLSVSNAVPSAYNIILKSQDSGVTGTPTTGNGLAAAAIAGDKFGNTTSAQLKVIYTVTPVATTGSCLGAPIDVTVQINPEPVLFSSGVPQVCSTNASNPANPINVVLGTNGTSAPVGSSGFKLISAVQYSNGGPFSGALPVGFSIVSATPSGSTGDLNLIKQDTYKNTSNVSVTVRYSIQATSATGGCLSVPLNYDVVINPEPILSPGLVTICSGVAPGALITLSAAAGSAAIAQYNLKQVLIQSGLTPNGSNAGLGVYNSGTFLGSDVFTNTTSGQLQTTYKIAPITGAGCVGADQSVILQVNPSPAVSTALNTIVCSNGASGIILATTPSSAAARPSLGYFITNIVQSVAAPQLQPNAGNVGINTTTGVNTNYISADKFVNNTNVIQTVTYSVQAITSALCTGPIQNVVLTIEPTITATPAPLISSICSNTLTSITLSSPSVPTAGPISFSYTATSSIGGQLSGFIPSVSNLPTGAIIADNLLNNSNSSADVTYSITPVANGAKNGSGCTGSPVPVVVHVDPIPKLTATPSIQTICEGVPSNIVLTTSTSPSGGGTVKFNVVSVVPDAGLTSTTAPGPYTNGQSIADTWSNANTSMSTAIYTLQPVVTGGLGCIGNQVAITLNVNPSPNVTATINNPTLVPAAICSNDLVNVSFTADVANTVNSWTASAISGAASGFSNGAGDLIFQTLKNTGVAPATVRYHVTPKASGCSGPAINVDINVDPIPDIILTAPAPVCYGATLNVPLTSSVASTNFTWVADPNNSGVSTNPGSGTAINYVVQDTLTSAEDFLTFTITGTGPGATACLSQPKVLTVLASPKMAGVFQNDPTWLCTGGKDFLQISLQGQAPFTLQYTDGTTSFTSTKVGNFKSIQIQPTVTTTYTLLSLKDNLGCSIPLTSSVVYTVNTTDPTFSITSPVEACTPNGTTLVYNQNAGTQYSWQWGDGNDSTYVATTNVTGQVIKHIFVNTSLTTTLKPHIVLTTSLDDHYPNGCAKSSTQAITVFAQLRTRVAIDKNVICSGDVVKLTNQTVGVPSTGHKWFYREVGSNDQLEVRTTSSTNYTLAVDSTKTNPLIYEIVYQATNTHCPADTSIQVTVYKSIKANFTDVVPYFVGGNSTATFTNTSKAKLDWPEFRFDWNFGLDSNPATLTSSASPINVNYSSAGPRDVTLLATNVAAEAAGLTCASSITQTVSVLLAPLIAKFTVDPKRACYPAKFTVTENLSTGDLYKWSVIDLVSRDTVASSNAALPIFSISNDGSYIIRLLTSSSFTGQTASDTAHVVLYPKPQAIFDAFPLTVYVPDQEVTTINGSGNTATQYLWDFGDGGTSTDYQPTYKYKIEGVDSLKFTAQYDHGGNVICSSTNFKIITAKQGGVAKIPNAFTPSTAGPSGGVGGVDLYNYVFLPQVKGVEEFNMQIYDRWGNMIFESNSQSIGWDGYDQHGRLMPAGVYVYKLTLRLSDQQRTTQIGDVTLIR